VRDDEEQRKNPQPKELAINASVLMQFLHKNCPRDVVELDLSDGLFETEVSICTLILPQIRDVQFQIRIQHPRPTFGLRY
jgi:hypothetical protein